LDPMHLREYTDEGPLLAYFREAGYEILVNDKPLMWFPVTDSILRRLRAARVGDSKKLDLNSKILGYGFHRRLSNGMKVQSFQYDALQILKPVYNKTWVNPCNLRTMKRYH